MSESVPRNSDGARVRTYLASLPPNARKIINGMRAAVRAAAPKASESMSYGFPVFKIDGKAIVWCAAWKNHTSIYPMTARRAKRDENAGITRWPHGHPLRLGFPLGSYLI